MSKLDKPSSGEHFPKLDLKIFYYLAVLLCFSVNKEDASSSIPPGLQNPSQESILTAISEDHVKEIRKHITNLVGQNIIEPDFKNIIPPVAEDFSRKTKQELVQELKFYYPDLDINISQADIEDLLEKEQRAFLQEIKETYESENDFVGFTEGAMIQIAEYIITGESHPFLNELFITLVKKVEYYCKNKLEIEAYKKDRTNAYIRLQDYSVNLLKKFYLLKMLIEP